VVFLRLINSFRKPPTTIFSESYSQKPLKTTDISKTGNWTLIIWKVGAGRRKQ